MAKPLHRKPSIGIYLEEASVNRATLLAAWMVTGAAYAQQTTGEEVLIRAKLTQRGIEFHVRSGGCTKKANFGVETISLKPLTVRLVRIRPDYCEANLAAGQTIQFTYPEIGAPAMLSEDEVKKVVIVNLVASP